MPAHLNAIGPNRTLLLKSGTYVLSDVPESVKEHVAWSEVFDGKTIAIKDVTGLTISGPPDRSARLLVQPRYAFVLEFKDCDALRLENLVLGHAPEEGYCQYGVLGLENVHGAKVINCDLFGCGTEGLTLQDVTHLEFSKSRVRDCAYGIMTLNDCRELNFADSEFTGNREFWGVRVARSDAVSFKRCSFTQNEIDGPLFAVTASTPVLLEDARLDGNTFLDLIDHPEMLEGDQDEGVGGCPSIGRDARQIANAPVGGSNLVRPDHQVEGVGSCKVSSVERDALGRELGAH